ncbi:hypothetical protein OYC64_000575 [Pagothenia borchgrevinki]|uniref:Uncharacterized protein n=1 Tax=Pagothenia borchgrevinki TaxID=8213 RepID=A0ABD2HDD3_PAGBO
MSKRFRGESSSIFLHRPPGNPDDPNYTASHLGAQ